MVYSDKSKLDFPDETIIIQNFHFSQKLWRKNSWKLPKLLHLEKRLVSKLSEISTLNFNRPNWKFEMKIVSKFQLSIFHTFQEISRKTALLTDRVGAGHIGSDRFIILNDSARPKIVIKTYIYIFSDFVQVLELFECRRDNTYITANWSHKCVAHS